jgi:predicted transcriptional regulator
MREEIVHFFTDKEEEFVSLLAQIGIQNRTARVLVFLANVPETTSLAIERGTDLRQPEVSMAMKYLKNRGWVSITESPSENKGRPKKVYRLAKPMTGILDIIESEKRAETRIRFDRIRKLRDYSG